jgi:hypothetical protein
MTHIEAIEQALGLCAGDERGMCRCPRCVALRDVLRQMQKKIDDRGCFLTVVDGRLKAL